jgi:hypothetical protein
MRFENEDDCELVVLNETIDAAGVGVVCVLSVDCRAVALSKGGADSDGLEDIEARCAGIDNNDLL